MMLHPTTGAVMPPVSTSRPTIWTTLMSNANRSFRRHHRRRQQQQRRHVIQIDDGQVPVIVGIVLILAGLVHYVTLRWSFLQQTEQLIIDEANYTWQELERDITIDPIVATAAIQSTCKLISALMLGVLAARANILDMAAIEALARLAYNVFEPCLIMIAVASTLSTGNNNLNSNTAAREGGAAASSSSAAAAVGLSHTSLFVLMPLCSLLHTAVGLACAYSVRAYYTRKWLDGDIRDAMFCVTFSNSANLPMVFAASLFPVNHALSTDMIACISFYLLILSPIFYTLGVDFLQSETEKKTMAPATLVRGGGNSGMGPQLDKLVIFLTKFLNPPVLGSVVGVVLGTIPMLRTHFLTPHSLGAPLMGAIQTLGTAYLPSTILVLAGSMAHTSNGNASNSSSTHDNNVASTTDLDTSMLSTTSENERQRSLHGVGAAPSSRSTPTLFRRAYSTLEIEDDVSENVIALNTSRSLSFEDGVTSNSKPDVDHHAFPWTSVVVITVCRFVIFPVASILLLNVLSKTWLLTTESARNQALLGFTFLVQGSMPPAQNSVLLLQLAGMKDRAMRLTRSLTVLYCISVVPMTMWVSHHLQATALMQYL